MDDNHPQFISMKTLLILLSLVAGSSKICFAQIPAVAHGIIRHYDSLPEAGMKTAFTIWLPENYTTEKRYPVIYMHDGQMLFDANQTWNKQEWNADESMAKLIEQDSRNAAIIVGVWNRGANRYTDYFPQAPFEKLTKENRAIILQALIDANRVKGEFHPASDAYLSFIVKELKPFVDANFSTLRECESTFMAGSSMGGLISLYALCKYPDVFGGVACFSTHWTGIHRNANNPFPKAITEYLSEHLPLSSKKHRIYLDTGTETLDSLYQKHHETTCLIVQKMGYTNDTFRNRVENGADHSELAWGKRFPSAIRFLLQTE